MHKISGLPSCLVNAAEHGGAMHLALRNRHSLGCARRLAAAIRFEIVAVQVNWRLRQIPLSSRMSAISRNGRMAEEFQRRLDSILGALDQHDPQSSAPSWSISDRIVQNRGQDPSDSESEDEREHQECIQVSWSTQRCQFRIVLELY